MEPVELPALSPEVVGDDELLTVAVTTWSVADEGRDDEDVERFEAALQACLDAERWGLASRLLGLLRVAADDRLTRAVAWAFLEGRRFPLSPPEVAP